MGVVPPEDNNESFDTKILTFSQKFKYVLTHISVEPLVFFYTLPSAMMALTTQNMNLEKACRVNLQYNSTVCDAMAIGDHTKFTDFQEAEVQGLVAQLLTIKTVIIGFFPTFLLLFFGSWSDRHSRRKPLILIPFFGDMLSCVCLFICAYFLIELSVEYVIFADALPFSLSGGPPCLTLGIFSYISDKSSTEDRTIRIGAASMFQNVGTTIGNAVAGPLIKPLGYKWMYITSTIITCSSFTYGIFIIEDKINYNSRESGVKQSFFKDFFDFGHIKNTFRVCFKTEKDRKRKMIIMMVIAVLIMGPLSGELAVVYLYTRIKFGWDEVNFSAFCTLNFIIQTCGSVFALAFFSKYLKVSDAMLGVIAMVSKITACLIYAFAPSGQYIYIGAFTEVFHGSSQIALRSIICKIVPPQELGQSNSIFGVIDAVMPLAFGPFYTLLYNYTLRTFPGAIFLLSAGLYIVVLLLFFWVYKTQSRQEVKANDGNREGGEQSLMENNIRHPTEFQQEYFS